MNSIFKTLSNETKAATAIQLTIMDAIEKGLTTPQEAISYMKTTAFEKQVMAYRNMFEIE